MHQHCSTGENVIVCTYQKQNQCICACVSILSNIQLYMGNSLSWLALFYLPGKKNCQWIFNGSSKVIALVQEDQKFNPLIQDQGFSVSISHFFTSFNFTFNLICGNQQSQRHEMSLICLCQKQTISFDLLCPCLHIITCLNHL